MRKREEKLAELARIAALLADRGLAPVAAAQARRDARRARIDRLAAQRATLSAGSGEPVLAAALARQAERLRRIQAEAMTDLARHEAELEIAKARARPAFGRKLALERLLGRDRGG